MRRRRSPHEKKRLSYERDHPTDAEYPHALRGYWAKRKAIAERSFRRRAKLALTLDDEGAVDTVRRKRMRKWGARSLGERVREKLETRALRVGYNFFKRPYDSRIHRERFTRLLRALTAERDGKARDHARAFGLFLEADDRSRFFERREWLEHYFEDEPAMRAQVTAWVRDRLASEKLRADLFRGAGLA